MHFSTKTKC